MTIKRRLLFARLLSILLLPVWMFPIAFLGGFVWMEYIIEGVNWRTGDIRDFYGYLFLAAFEMLTIYMVIELTVRYAR